MSPRSPSPLSEGEIFSGDEEKAISTSTHRSKDTKVNASTRHRSGSSSRAALTSGMGLSLDGTYDRGGRDESYRRDRSRSRSPYRANRPASGEKRRNDEDHYSRKASSDPRRFKVHYENDRPNYDSSNRFRRPYADHDKPAQAKGTASYDDRFGGRSREAQNTTTRDRGRDRSRSPFRHDKVSGINNQANGASTGGEKKHVSKITLNHRQSSPETSHEQEETKVRISLSQQANAKAMNASDLSDELRVHGEAPVEPTKQLTEAELIEQRRKRREAIKARHKSNPPLLVQALEQNIISAPSTPLHDSSGTVSEQHSPQSSAESPKTPLRDSPPGSPASFTVSNDEELADRRHADPTDEEEGPSAADYDPNQDMQEDRPDHKRFDLQQPEGDDNHKFEFQQSLEVPKQSKEFDMFAEDDDDDDMFAPDDPTAKPAASITKQAKALDQSLLDNWDYPDGHYRIILGELLDGRYAVQQQIGKGTFATVVRAQDNKTGTQVAVKIACNNDTMYKAGQKEMDMLQLLNQNDPDDKKHIIRLLRQFEHKGHLCLVFENLSADLREVLKKFGRNVGLNLKAIRSYAQQMFLALSQMKKCQILHADLKPDNILVSEKRNMLKICDLGTASFADDAEITPYLVSRFYRAPEVILGMPFDYAIDMWSIGCTLFELYTGRILFAGSDNNQMLRVIQECRGKFPMRMLKRSTLADKHFDVDGNFFSQERDKITGKASLRQLHFSKALPGKDLRARLSGNLKGMRAEEIREHAAFVDLMEKCLQLDPARRVSPGEALRHGFITHGGEAKDKEKEKAPVKVAMNLPRMK